MLACICFSHSKMTVIITVILPVYTALVAAASTRILGYHLQLGKFTSLLNPFPLRENNNNKNKNNNKNNLSLEVVQMNESWMETV